MVILVLLSYTGFVFKRIVDDESLFPYGYLFASNIFLERPQKFQKLTWTSEMEHIVCNVRNKFVIFSDGGGLGLDGFDVLRIVDFSLGAYHTCLPSAYIPTSLPT